MATSLQRAGLRIARFNQSLIQSSKTFSSDSDALVEIRPGEVGMVSGIPQEHLHRRLLSHPFITKYEDSQVDLAAFVRGVFDPVQRLKDLADMFAIHYYLLFDGPDEHWLHMKTLYNDESNLRTSIDMTRKTGGADFEDATYVVIYSPARSASQQGAGKVGRWKINFLSTQKWENPLMGWTSTGDLFCVDFAQGEIRSG